MSGPNGNGQSKVEAKVEAMADSVTTRLLARMSMIALAPILAFLFYQLWGGQEEIAGKLDALNNRLWVVETKLNERERADKMKDEFRRVPN